MDNQRYSLPIKMKEPNLKPSNKEIKAHKGNLSDCTEKHQRFLAMEGLLFILESAPRIGEGKDEPEGVRYIQITETLANRMATSIREYIEHGVEYLKMG